MAELSMHQGVLLITQAESKFTKVEALCTKNALWKDVEIVWMWKRDEGCKMSRDHAHIRTPWKYVDVFVRARQIYVNLGLPLGLTTSTPNSAIPP